MRLVGFVTPTRTDSAELDMAMRHGLRTRLGLLALTGALVMTMASPAVAAKPLVFEEGVFDTTFMIPGGVGVCDFPIQAEESGKFRATIFFDRDGETRQAKIHSNGTTYWSRVNDEGIAVGDVAVDRWVNNTFLELAPGSDEDTPPVSETVVGNPWNVHLGGGGVLVNDSGRIVFDADGELVTVNGPHQAFFGDFGDLCAALAPPADD